MKNSTILIVSDIHFGKFANCSEFALDPKDLEHPVSNAVPMRTGLIDSMKASKVELDALVVSGDLTSMGEPKEFHACANTIVQMGGELGIPVERLYFAYGNHDVNWRICQLAEDVESRDHYQRIAAHVGPLFVPNAEADEKGPVPGSALYDTPMYRIFLLNSSYFSHPSELYHHGKLGSDQLQWLEDRLASHCKPDKWNILVTHHHPRRYPYPTLTADISSIEEGPELLRVIGKYGIDFVIHGHRHHPTLVTHMEDNWCHPITFLCAGSVAVNPSHRNNGEILAVPP